MENSDKIANIKLLWSNIINLCSTLRSKHNDNLNGLQLWNNIKASLIHIKGDEIKWNPEHLIISSSLSEIKDSLREINEDGSLIEKNHFFLQLFNIPIKDTTAPFNRLLQIALNIGQLIPSLDDEKFGFNIEEIFNDNKLVDINTYMLDEDIVKYNITKSDIDNISIIITEMETNAPLIKKLIGGSKSKNRYSIKYSKIN